MNLERYEFKAGNKVNTFEFVSEGPKGKIMKIVQFKRGNYNNLFNLAFGDLNIETGDLDDKIVSNNSDSEKVLATVIACVHAFSNTNPEAWIYARGSTPSRTRLYRMGISKFLPEFGKDFGIYGKIGNEWHVFSRNVEYEAFVAKRKIANFTL